MKPMRLFLFFIFFIANLYAKQLEIEIQAPSAILINADSGAILYEKNAEKIVFPASITKVATALFVLEKNRLNPNSKFTVPREALVRVSSAKKVNSHYKYPAYWLEADGRNLGIKEGETIFGEALLYGMLMGSGNDAANAVAYAASSSVPKFMDELNKFLKEEIACTNTHFCNPHGLHHPNHITTAYDMALIMKRALKIQSFRKIISSHYYEWHRNHVKTLILQLNKLILKSSPFYYPYVIGGKTGYHSHAGYTLVTAATKNDRTLIAVVLGCKNSEERFKDAKILFSRAFQERKEIKTIFNRKELFTRDLKGAKTPLKASLKEDFCLITYSSEDQPLKAFLHWDSLKLPISSGTKVGEIRLLSERGELIDKRNLFATTNVEPSFWFKITKLIVP